MTGIRQRMRRRSSADTADTTSPSPEAQPGAVADPAAATSDAPAQPTTDAAATAPGTPAATEGTPASAEAAAQPAAAAAPGAAPAPGTPGATPADVAATDPTAGAATPDHPGFATRGRLRRRLRYLRRVRELGYRDLGGLVFDQHRFARPNETLVQTKVAALAQIDGEVRALERALEDKRAIAELREAGIAACPRCGAIHGSESRYCPACGLALSGPTEMAAVHAPAPAGASAASYAPVTSPPNPVTIPPMPAPITPAPATPPVVGPASTQPPTPPTPAPAPANPAAPSTGDAALQHTIHLRREDEDQPTTVFRAADAGKDGVSLGSGDPLTGPRPADAPDLKSGDPLAPRPAPGSDSSDAEPESRP